MGRSPPPVVEQGQQLPGVVQVILGDLAKRNSLRLHSVTGRKVSWEAATSSRLGDVVVVEVVLHTLGAHTQQHSQGAQEAEGPERPSGQPLVEEKMWARPCRVELLAKAWMLTGWRPPSSSSAFSSILAEGIWGERGGESVTALG